MTERPLFLLGDEARRHLDTVSASSDTRRARTRQRVIERMQAVRQPFLQRARYLVAAIALVVASSAGFMALKALARPITYEAGERQGRLGDELVAPSGGELDVSFSEGTRIALLAGARARVQRARARGAEVRLEEGAALVNVNHRLLAEWVVQAGPFAIDVTGTRFAVAWDGSTEALSIDLYEGSLSVTGCGIAEPVQLVAGQLLRAECGPDRLSIGPLAEGGSDKLSARRESIVSRAQPAPSTTLPPAPASTLMRTPEVASSRAHDEQKVPLLRRSDAAPSSAPVPALDWRALARTGDFKRAFEAASMERFEIRSATLEDLSLYADAARLAAHPEPAARAYETLRRNFPASSQASAAAFALGRLALDRGEGASAAKWLETYLAEAPRGELASVALGRLLELAIAGGDARGARELAVRYQSTFPTGAHAEAARQVLKSAAGVAPRP